MIFKVLLLILYLPFFLLGIEMKNPVSKFLHASKIHYLKILDKGEVIHFVLGNESADLDSIVSSICYAYLLAEENRNEFYIPLLNIPREEILLRKDVLYLFELLDISLDDLLFYDDLPFINLFQEKRLCINLVDHNVLRRGLIGFSDVVERIIDHHADENKMYPLIGENKLIAPVGSNATLIAEKIFASSNVKCFSELATLLLAPILIDTSNFKSEKMTPRDIEAAKKLKKIASIPKDFYPQLKNAKNDVSGLTVEMLLRKDFKEYLDEDIVYGISSLPHDVHWNLDNLDLISEDIKKFMTKQSLDYFFVFMSSDTACMKRTILVHSSSLEHLKAFDAHVQTEGILKNILIPFDLLDAYHLRIYRTKKAIARKQLQPLLHLAKINRDEF